jgi:hypothetical protein
MREIAELRGEQIIANLMATPYDVLLKAKQHMEIQSHNAEVEKKKRDRKNRRG